MNLTSPSPRVGKNSSNLYEKIFQKNDGKPKSISMHRNSWLTKQHCTRSKIICAIKASFLSKRSNVTFEIWFKLMIFSGWHTETLCFQNYCSYWSCALIQYPVSHRFTYTICSISSMFSKSMYRIVQIIDEIIKKNFSLKHLIK